jgi:hypothetical protein
LANKCIKGHEVLSAQGGVGSEVSAQWVDDQSWTWQVPWSSQVLKGYLCVVHVVSYNYKTWAWR